MYNSYFINYPALFQGERKIKTSQNYFEGWYFKNTNRENSIAFIPGISIQNGQKSAFIQIITNKASYYVPFSFSAFHFCHMPFSIQIGDNYFSLEEVRISISTPEVSIQGHVRYQERQEIQKSKFAPNIMGPFSYFPFMECHHAILSMKHLVDGSFTLNDTDFIFEKDTGYIEKDWGTSFPRSYIWTQSNCFSNPSTSFFCSIAHIPFIITSFTGFICVLMVNGEEYRFTTYNGSKLIHYKKSKDNINIKLKKDDYVLQFFSDNHNYLPLLAPKCGNMNQTIQESINSKISIILSHKGSIVYEDTSYHAGLEIV